VEQGETCLGVSLFGNSGFRIGETDCKMITRDDFGKGIKGNFWLCKFFCAFVCIKGMTNGRNP
jgi:hypothetical protein